MNIKEVKNVEKNYKLIRKSPYQKAKLIKNIKRGILIVVAGVMITAMSGCSSCGSKTVEETSVTSEVIDLNPVIEEESEVVETKDADQIIYTLEDDVVFAANDALRAGIDLSYDHIVDANDIDTYAGQFTNYYIVANMDKFDDRVYAEMMIGSNVSSEDLIESFMNLNTAFKKHLITVTNDNLYDFNNLYNDEDAEILNHAQSLIATMNENDLDSAERKEAAKEFYTYATEIINSTNARMAISPQALDTLVTFIEAYDELTFNYKSKKVKGAYVDDELEHALNISKESCFGVADEANIEVQDHVVENFKSLFRTHILKDLNAKYEAAKEERSLQLQLGNELNEMNSYESIITYVKGLIKIDNYKALEYDYQTWLKVLKGIIVVQNGKISLGTEGIKGGVSNGQGGIISQQQLNQYGINTNGKTDEQIRHELEEAVKKEEDKKAEENKKITATDDTGKEPGTSQPISGTTEDVQNGYAAGYAAGQSGNYNCPAGVSDAYKKAYDNGFAAGKANAQEMQDKYKGEQETFEPVPNGPSTTEEKTTTEDYTPAPQPEQKPSNPTPSQPGESFEPVEPEKVEEKVVIETIEYNDSEGSVDLPEIIETFEEVDPEVVETYEEIETISSRSTTKEELLYYRNMLVSLPVITDSTINKIRI